MEVRRQVDELWWVWNCCLVMLVSIIVNIKAGKLTPPGNSPSCKAFGPPINMTECTLNSTPAAVIRLKSRPRGVSSSN